MPGFKCQNKFYAPVSVMQIGPRVGYRVEFITCYVFFSIVLRNIDKTDYSENKKLSVTTMHPEFM